MIRSSWKNLIFRVKLSTGLIFGFSSYFILRLMSLKLGILLFSISFILSYLISFGILATMDIYFSNSSEYIKFLFIKSSVYSITFTMAYFLAISTVMHFGW